MDKNRTRTRSNGSTNQPTHNSGISGSNAESGNQPDDHAGRNETFEQTHKTLSNQSADQRSAPETGASNKRGVTSTSNGDSGT
jgi:hypothetical protein